MPQFLERLLETKGRFRGERIGQQRFGNGKTITKTKARVEKISTRVKSKKLNFVPKVNEALKQWSPGQRVTEAFATDSQKSDISMSSPSVKKQEIRKQRSSADISF
jgi:hypothetical protein